MPRTCIDTADAIELAEILQLITRWLAADPATLAPALLAYIGPPPTASTRSAPTCTASPSSSAATTASSSSAKTRPDTGHQTSGKISRDPARASCGADHMTR